MQDNTILDQGKNLYKKKDYAKALAFFLGLPTESEVDKNNYIKGSQIVLKKIGFEDFYERTIWKVIE